MRRRQPPIPTTVAGVPTDLAAGPCVPLWATPGSHFPQWSAWHNWQDAREQWATAQGLDLATDYRHLPAELHDRAPHSREVI